VVIDRKQNGIVKFAGAAEINCGLTAIAADFQTGAAFSGNERKLIKTGGFTLIKKTFNII